MPFQPSFLPEKAEKLTIWPLSDLHLPRAQSQIVLRNRPFAKRADLVVFLGDMVRAYATEREYQAVRAFVESLNRPFRPICGNHEWYFEEFSENSAFYGEIWNQASNAEQRAKLRRFLNFWGLETLWSAQNHDLGHFVWLSLDSVETQKQEVLSAPQLDFLSEQLEIAGEKPLFVFCHAPVLIENRLDLIYYEPERSACIELESDLKTRFLKRAAPTFWMSGHIHLQPNHHLFPPYSSGGNVWQIHIPDTAGYGRFARHHHLPRQYEGAFSRLLEIDARGVSFLTHDHLQMSDCGSFRVDF